MDSELREELKDIREKVELALRETATLKAGHVQLERTVTEKHEQNRRDIHSLRNQFQQLMDKFFAQLKDMRDDFQESFATVTSTIHEMQLSSAKAKGYWLAMGAVVAVLIDLGKIAIEHYWK